MRKSIQQMLILAACAVAPSVMGAATLSVDEAKEIAAEFFQSGDVLRLADRDAFVLAHTAVDKASNPICYVFNARDGKGFVIVSADDSSLPVIGYSDTATWDAASVSNSAEQVLLNEVPVSSDTRRRMLSRASARQERKVLSTPEWSQEAPFNNSIPNRRLTGCVGVALAEILKYHNYPANRPASLAGQSGIAYDWSGMRMDNYRGGYSQNEANAVATLVADAAIGIGTDFGMSSSSAYEVKVPYALTSLFGYDAGVSYKKRQEMDRDSWDQVIVNEIDGDRPVLYCGQDVSAGHAFVCDGYEMRGSTPFFHINWGWGGSANGYYATDALNPVVSKAHKYNDLMTIVYNIKPAANATAWSDLHITSDGRQVGLTMDVTDITSASSFTVRAGAIKNISNTDFAGKLSVALFGADGKMKCLLNDGRSFNLIALQIHNFVDFLCSVPAGTSVVDGDIVRLVAQPAFSTEWIPMAGDLLAPGEALAKNNAIPYFNVKLPVSTDDAEVSASADKVIKGRDYTFSVVPKAVDKVITVKANGFILTPDANNGYRLSNVLEDQEITILAQNASDVLSKKVVWVTAGDLQNQISENEAATVKDLTLFGTINVNDFNFMRDRMKLERLDISQVSIVANGSNPANAIPNKAFQNYRSLKQIILPGNLTTLKNGCFNNTGLTSVEIPSSVGTWEYNVFLACYSLQEVIVRRSSPAWINWCVFNGTPKAKLVVPVGASGAYKSKEYWQDFKEIVEENAVAPTHYTVMLQEKKGLRIYDATEGTEFAPATVYKFKVEADNTYSDYNMEVFANAERLYADSEGFYSAKINRNTLIHVEFKEPQATGVDKQWVISGIEGGIGLVSDVVNVPVGQSFNVRVNALKVPAGYASKFFAIVLTDRNGRLKEVLSTVMNNLISEDGSGSNIVTNFNCKVKESTVREGDMLRLATSVSSSNANRVWNLVSADEEGIVDRLNAVGNQVPHHTVTLPASNETFKVEGQSGEVVRGMPYSFKVTPVWANYRVTVKVNGEDKAFNAAVANVSIPAVKEDLVVEVECKEIEGAGESSDNGFVVVDVQAGQLATKMNAVGWPEKLKLVGSLNANDFTTFQNNCTKLKDLDLSDVSVPSNTFPSYAFYSMQNRTRPSLRTIIMPKNVTTIATNAFIQCISLTDVVLPPTLTKVGAYAFSSCIALNTMTIDRSTTPACDFNPFPSRTMTLFVPKGAETAYKNASYWSKFNVQTIEDPKTYYWVNYDPAKLTFYGQVDPNNIGVGKAEEVVWILLPNLQDAKVIEKYPNTLRPGVAFKFYDNGVDMFEWAKDKPDVSYDWSCTNSKQGGIYRIYFNPAEESGMKAPDNHKIDLDFYYPITFKNIKGAESAKAKIVNLKDKEEWTNVEMWRFGGEGTPTLYKENSDIQFTLSIPDSLSNSDFTVMVEQKVMTKPGLNPEYEHQEFEAVAEDGIYTIPSLAGDATVKISPAVPVENDGKLTAEDILNPVDEGSEELTEVIIVGELPDEAFETLKDNFSSLESIDLSEIVNTTIPNGAFAGMENLQNVTVPPTVTEIGAGSFKDCESLETLTLPGVTSIGEGAFEGCGNLTSILLPSLGSGSASGMPGMHKAGAVGGVTVESFKGLNPNCLIYVGSADIPDAESLNVILNIDQQRVAASDILLDGNHPFNAPASFLLGEHMIYFTTEITASDSCDIDGGWKTIMLPFEPTDIKINAEFTERAGSGINIVSFDGENAEEMTPQTKILANRPYLANVCAPFSSVPVTFTASAREQGDSIIYDVPFTPVPEETVAVGKEFSLYGSFDGETRNVDYLVLDDNAGVFVAPTEGEDKVVPFSAYLVANAGTVKNEMAVGEHPLWIYDPEYNGVAGTKLYRSGKIELVSPTEKASVYYTVDGTDPKDSETRRAYTEPFQMEGEGMTVKAVAEYNSNVSDVVVLDFELKTASIDYELKGNWNWISHFAETPVKVADFATEGVELIRSLDKEVVNDPQMGMIGSLKELLPIEGYKMNISGESWNGKISGIAFDPSATIKLNKGWNWIGTPVDEGSLVIEDLLAALEAEEGDMLVGLDGFVQADAEGAWKGTVSHMVPGAGYLFFSNSDKEFVYSIVAAHETEAPAKAPVVAAEGLWKVDNHKYASVMPVIATLEASGDIEDYQVAAFCGDECRGIGVIVDGTVMINVHGNAGDIISFRFIGSDSAEMISSTTAVFAEKPQGTFGSPFAISASDATAVAEIFAGSIGLSYEDGAFILGGDLTDVKGVEIYDLSGRLIAKSAGERTLKVGDIDGSVVTVVIRKADSTSSVKMIVK